MSLPQPTSDKFMFSARPLQSAQMGLESRAPQENLGFQRCLFILNSEQWVTGKRTVLGEQPKDLSVPCIIKPDKWTMERSQFY